MAAALVALGYQRAAASDVAARIAAGADDSQPLEELVKLALAQIGSAQAAQGQPG